MTFLLAWLCVNCCTVELSTTNVLWIRNYWSACSEPITSHALGGLVGTLLHMWRTSWPPSWKYDVISKIRLQHLMCIYWRTVLPNFIPIQFETTEYYAVFEERHPNSSKMSRSVADPKTPVIAVIFSHIQNERGCDVWEQREPLLC